MRDKFEKNENLDIVANKLELLKANFPQCFTKGGELDFRKLETELSNEVDIVKEGYSLNWLGKSYAKVVASLETETVISPDLDHNSFEENKNSRNAYIKGDNLDVLKHLVNSYAEKIKMIYIDPPYNTGSDEFVYHDNFKFTPENLAELANVDNEEAKRILDFTERKSNSHSAWLTFMYPRLYIARQMLIENGVIFISIDENEQAQLRMLCDYVFGEMNFVGEISVLSNPKGRSQDKFIATCHEYILIYSKTPQPKGRFSIDKTPEEIEKDYPLTDKKGKYREIELRNTHREFGKFNRPNLFYPLYAEKDGTVSISPTDESSIEILPIWDDGFEGCWTWGLEKSKKQLEELVAKKVANKYKIYRKNYSGEDAPPRKQVKSIWNDKKFHTEKGQQVFNLLFDTKEKIFQSPKSVELIKRTILMAQVENNDIVMDFFGGSSTTAQAVMEINSECKTYLNYILVQLPEETKEKSEARKLGYVDITQIGIERIKRAAAKIKKETKDDFDCGFKIFETKVITEEISENDLSKMLSFTGSIISDNTILNKFGKETVLTTWMLEDGHPLTDIYEEVNLGAGYNAFKVQNTLYLLDGEFNIETNLKLLIEKVENEATDFIVNKLVLFGYSFSTQTIASLKDNMKHLRNGRSSADIHVEVRY